MANPKPCSGNEPYIFVSYSARDKSAVYPFITALQETYNVRFDDGALPRKEREEAIAASIRQCAVFLALLSEDAQNDPDCNREIALAREWGRPILTVLLRDLPELPKDLGDPTCVLSDFPTLLSAVAALGDLCPALEKAKKKAAGRAKDLTTEDTANDAPQKKKKSKGRAFFAVFTFLAICAAIATVIVWKVVLTPAQKAPDVDSPTTQGEEPADLNSLASAKIGSIITLGKYEQNNVATDGKEQIEWIVLDKKEGMALVISRYALDCVPYNFAIKDDLTWETSSLREWLNGSFYEKAFNKDEQSVILTVTVPADPNPEYPTPAGNNTEDKIFLLSLTEVYKYFPTEEARRCTPTEYTKARGAWASSHYGTYAQMTCWWWLRSPGLNPNQAASIQISGAVSEFGSTVNYGNNAVRPAMWVRME